MKKIAIITDAWHPQVSGVVRVTETLRSILKERGYELLIIEPNQFANIPIPRYQEIRLALFPSRGLARRLEAFKPDAVHIMTEGPLGFAARRYCIRRGLRFTTWYHTHFDHYINMHLPGLLRVGNGGRAAVPQCRGAHVCLDRGFAAGAACAEVYQSCRGAARGKRCALCAQ